MFFGVNSSTDLVGFFGCYCVGGGGGGGGGGVFFGFFWGPPPPPPKKKPTKSMNLPKKHKHTQEYIKGKSPLFILLKKSENNDI